MKDRAEAFTLQAKSGQWMVEVWQDGTPVQCVAGLALRTAACGSANGAGSHQAKRGRGWCVFEAETRQKPFLSILGGVCLAWRHHPRQRAAMSHALTVTPTWRLVPKKAVD